jgi:subtilisin family serine protease
MSTASRIGLRLTAVAALAVFAFACADGPAEAPIEQPDFSVVVTGDFEISDRHLIMFRRKGVPAGFTADVERLGGSVVFSHDIGVAAVSGLDETAASALGRKKYVRKLYEDNAFELNPIVNDEAVEADAVMSPGDPTTADFYLWQWNMRAIQADDVWGAQRTGSSDVTVAILDTGIDYLHADLEGRVDLSRSVSFMPFDDYLTDLYFAGRDYVTDLYFHGTHVAATAVSNSYVAAGVTTQTTLIGVKVCGYDPDSLAIGVVYVSCPFSAVIDGVLHAVDNGADVINMSLGGGFTKAHNGWFVGFINRVFNYANNRGVTVVVSAGNAAWDLDHNGNAFATYCDVPNTICVSATAPEAGAGYAGPWIGIDAIAPYTNFGNSAISVAAPGGDAITNDAGWVWAACSQTSLVIGCWSSPTWVVGASGTSMAAPHVSGVESLLVEDVGRRPGRIKTIIQRTADDLGKKGNDPYYGKGRLNAASAVGAN